MTVHFQDDWGKKILKKPYPGFDRDSWCTPKWLTDLLPTVTLDPCSNPRSTVKAHRTCSLENGEDGLTRSWKNCSVMVNPPYSKILPWAEKTRDCAAFIFLVNHDPTTKWWRELRANGGHAIFLFHRRIQFTPPEGITPSTNPRPQSLVCDENGRRLIGDALNEYGSWWLAL